MKAVFAISTLHAKLSELKNKIINKKLNNRFRVYSNNKVLTCVGNKKKTN